jgi:murein DD-endopeptidase MepM/ murein hydrolase activator NlpD
MIHIIKTKIELFLLLILISGCTITVGTTSRNTSGTSEYTYHYVRRGENLFRISRYYYDTESVKAINAGIEKIIKANNIRPEQISVGQRLLIPGTTKKQPSDPLLPPTTTPPVIEPQVSPTEQRPAEEFHPMITDKAFIWPVTGKVTCGFGELDNQGIDILAKPGADILAADSGSVVFSGTTPKYQETIILEHQDSIYTVYGHDLEILVKQGDAIKKGDTIGKVKSGTHRIRYLHFEIRIDNVAVNPLVYLPEQQN